jgi:hypothetical protein
MTSPLRRTLFLCAVASGFIVAAGFPLVAGADDATVVTNGFVTVEEQGPLNILKPWTLVNMDQQNFAGSGASSQVQIPTGAYTFFVEKPDGLTVQVQVFEGSALVQTIDQPQLSFTYAGQTNLKILVTFTITESGKVSVMSSPQGVPFELTGPNKILMKGTTPTTFDAVPLGQYSVKYLPSGCSALPPKSGNLKIYSRLDFSVTIQCAGLQVIEDQQKSDESFVSFSVDGKKVVFRDVPSASWFATYALAVAQRGIITGYTDSMGNFSGQFGPENAITIAQLAKIAHRVAGLNETVSSYTPDNPSATGWSVPFIASAEDQGWTVYLDPTVDVNRLATRAEVLVTLYQALDIPIHWPKGVIFADVTRRTKYAGAIETAAMDNIVSGTKDDNGSSKFQPESNVNRAEMAKIITLAIAKYRPGFAASSSSSSY